MPPSTAPAPALSHSRWVTRRTSRHCRPTLGTDSSPLSLKPPASTFHNLRQEPGTFPRAPMEVPQDPSLQRWKRGSLHSDLGCDTSKAWQV